MDKRPQIINILHSMQALNYSDMQSIDLLLDFGFQMVQHIAFSGEAMSEAKEKLHAARKSAYLKIELSTKSQGKQWAPSLLKDYVNDTCSTENAYYELCERCNRAATHTLDIIRTAISALKAEMQSITFQPNR